MNHALFTAVLLALAAAGCGGTAPAGAPAHPVVVEQRPADTGVIRIAMRAATTPGATMAEILIRDVFHPSQLVLVECVAKPELLDGQAFCDEMTVLPPGVYELEAESQSGCTMTQDHYTAQVVAGHTTEVQIDLVCC